MRLSRAFYKQPTLRVAPKILGKVLVRRYRGKILSGIIAEVEAYQGLQDPASHAFRGETLRNRVMFGHPGFSYVYFVYGMYYCMNVVTEAQGFPAALLIRGLIPLEGVPTMQRLRFRARMSKNSPKDLVNGSGKICSAMAITMRQYGCDLTRSDDLWIEDRGIRVHSRDIITTPRIGVSAAKDSLWRFVWKHPDYSK